MNTSATVPNVEYVLEIPELKANSIVGGGCCAMPADFLIEESLREMGQVHEVVVSEDEGLVHVWVTEPTQGLLDELVARIEDLGYRVLN